MNDNEKNNKERYEVEIEGPLTINEVIDVKQKLSNLLSEYDCLELNFKSLRECDVVGIQLLYSVIKTAQESKKDIIMTNIPPCLNETIEKTGLDSENIIQ